MAFRVANGYEPKDATIRKRLGLPVTATVVCCKKCGGAHMAKRCTRRPTYEERTEQYERWRERMADSLRRAVEWAERA